MNQVVERTCVICGIAAQNMKEYCIGMNTYTEPVCDICFAKDLHNYRNFHPAICDLMDFQKEVHKLQKIMEVATSPLFQHRNFHNELELVSAKAHEILDSMMAKYKCAITERE
jgi:hypothetical protein